MGNRKHGGITKEQALMEAIDSECTYYEKNRRLNALEDAKEIIDYQADQNGQPLVIIQEGRNINVNFNIDITPDTDPDKLQELLDVIRYSNI